MIKDWHPNYTKIIENSKIRKQTTQLKIGKKSEQTSYQRKYTNDK